MLKLPKLGLVEAVIHRPVKGQAKSVTISREGSHWYASVLVERQVADPAPRPIVECGADLNIVSGVVLSDGTFMPAPRLSETEAQKRARLHKNLSSKKKGSANRRKPQQALRRFEAKIARRRRNAAHQTSRRIADATTHVPFENINVRAMTASARGTVEDPGRNVAQKAGGNRSFLDVAPGIVRRLTAYKVEWAGGVCVEVSAAYTSQTCSACCRHPKDDEATAHFDHGRVSRDRFVCPLCGYAAHADVNAARNILARGRVNWAADEFTAGGAPAAACGGLSGKEAGEAGTKIPFAQASGFQETGCFAIQEAPVFRPERLTT